MFAITGITGQVGGEVGRNVLAASRDGMEPSAETALRRFGIHLRTQHIRTAVLNKRLRVG
jgi:hypothetical protein